MKDLLIWNSHLCLYFCFYQFGLCSVSYTANDSIYHFCIMIKDFHFFFKSDCCSRLCNFLCVICIQADLLCYFLLNEKAGRSSQLNSLFIENISTAKPFSLLVRGYIEVKINKHEALTQLTLRCLKFIKGIFIPHAVWQRCFLIPPQSFYGKRTKSLKKIFSSSENAIWSIFLEISRNRCANTNIH